MSIFVICECGRRVEAPESGAGLGVRCPVCGRALTVPLAEVLLIPEETETERAVTSGKAIASLALGGLFFLGCFGGVPAIHFGIRALKDIDYSGGRLRGRRLAAAGIVLGMIGCLFTFALLFLGASSGREGARRSQCISNLKQIGLALHIYHSVHGRLPPAAIVDRDGKPLLSWRVAILPFIENEPLYDRFHRDEPWDSPHNLSLLDAMPRMYACPSDTALEPGMTNYQVVIGPRTAFPPDFTPLKLEDFTDGTSRTLLVSESRRVVPWTKPEDLPVDMALLPAGLGSYHYHGFNTVFADDSVRFLNSSVPPGVLSVLLTRDGGDHLAPDSD